MTIAAILSEAGGRAIDHYNSECVKRRIAARIRTLQVAGADQYIERLRTDSVEVQSLNALLSLHVSTFYRDPMTFSALRQMLLERIRSTTLPRLRCWSAGCAGGEEPYSLALLAAQSPELQGSVEIVASDISQSILDKARSGLFIAEHLRNLPEEERALYFTAEGGQYRLAEKLRSMVTFFQHDLLAETPYPRVELILCRYVLIYLKAADQEEIVARFAAALPPGGILILGRTEVLRDKRGLFAPIIASERIYRRI